MAVTVNGAQIDESLIDAEMKRLRPEYTAYVKSSGGEPLEAQLREWAEEDLIEAALFRAAAIATQPVPSAERVHQYLQEYAQAYADLPEEERLVKAREALQQRRLIKEIRKGVDQPSEQDVKAYYDANPDMFMMPELLRLSHICRYVDVGTKANAFLELLRIQSALKNFSLNWMEAVETFSESFKHDQGLFAPVARGDLPAGTEETLFALKPGEVSDVIEMDGRSLHLFRLLAKEAAHPLDFKEIKEHIAGVLFEQACQDALHATFDDLKASAVIQRTA